MAEDRERRIRNTRQALDERMRALREYSNIPLRERGKFDENELLIYVNRMEDAIRDYERAVDDRMQQ
jgi:hypothetical protein